MRRRYYWEDRKIQGKKAKLIGFGVTLFCHLILFFILFFSGLKYLYPPPPESTFLLDFTEQPKVKVKQEFKGTAPKVKKPNKKKEIKLIQKSKSPYTAEKKNTTVASKQDDFGDVETIKQKEEPKIDPRASFPGMSKKDSSTTAPDVADKSKNLFKAGQENGNTSSGKRDGSANAHLRGRTVNGSLPRPLYNVQNTGKVVVTIWVDKYGNVKKAQAGAEGTTVSDITLWKEARNAALKAHFNISASAPALQKGQITYIFSLTK